MNSPLISVVIPAYNAQSTILDTLHNFEEEFEYAQKTFNFDFEVIIVDDGSDDNTKESVARKIKGHPNYRLFTKRNSGVSDSRNFGLRQAIGIYIWFFDADDLLFNHSIAEVIKILVDKPDILRFSSHTLDKHTKNIEIFNNIHGYKLERFPTYRNYLEAGGHIPFSCWAIIIKKELLIDNEIEFDISKTISEDVIWNLTVAKKLGDRSYFSTNLNVVKYMVNINSAINSDDISKNLRHLESSLAYHESLTIDFADTAYLTKVVDIYRHTCLRQIITRFLSCKFSPSLNDEKRIEVRRVINDEKDKGGLIKFFLIISKSNWTFLPVQFLYRNIFIPFVKPFLRRN